MRLRFLHPKPGAEPKASRQRAAPPGDDDAVALARTRARRRLVGALVLLAIGVIGFPMLFETQPRPLPLDTPIELPARDAGALPRTPAPARPAPPPVVPPDAGTEVAVATPGMPASAPAASPARTASAAANTASQAAQQAAPVPAAAPAPRSSAPAVAAPPRPAAAAPPPPAASAAAAGRYVVQVGAYADAATLREARAKVEKLGLKTYTQVIESDGKPRTRVRLGPYATRDEADAAAAKLKRAGLPANVLAL